MGRLDMALATVSRDTRGGESAIRLESGDHKAERVDAKWGRGCKRGAGHMTD